MTNCYSNLTTLSPIHTLRLTLHKDWPAHAPFQPSKEFTCLVVLQPRLNNGGSTSFLITENRQQESVFKAGVECSSLSWSSEHLFLGGRSLASIKIQSFNLRALFQAHEKWTFLLSGHGAIRVCFKAAASYSQDLVRDILLPLHLKGKKCCNFMRPLLRINGFFLGIPAQSLGGSAL